MWQNKRIISIIPARGGSTGLKNKNILPIGGIPMIGWAIQNSLSIKEIDTTIVTTDDNNIAKIARDYGAQTPFLRSAKLSKSSSAFTPVILDALQRVKSKFGVLIKEINQIIEAKTRRGFFSYTPSISTSMDFAIKR